MKDGGFFTGRCALRTLVLLARMVPWLPLYSLALVHTRHIQLRLGLWSYEFNKLREQMYCTVRVPHNTERHVREWMSDQTPKSLVSR